MVKFKSAFYTAWQKNDMVKFKSAFYTAWQKNDSEKWKWKPDTARMVWG